MATVGGAAPGTARPISGTVTVTGTAPPLHVAVAADGVYTLSLPPGRYTVTGTSPQYIVNGRAATCTAAGPVDVVAGHTVTADVSCPMR